MVVVISCSVIGVDSKGVIELGSSKVAVVATDDGSDGSIFSNSGIEGSSLVVAMEILEAKDHSAESTLILDGSVEFMVIIEGSVEFVFSVSTIGGVPSTAAAP